MVYEIIRPVRRGEYIGGGSEKIYCIPLGNSGAGFGVCRQRCRIKAGRSDRIANRTANSGEVTTGSLSTRGAWIEMELAFITFEIATKVESEMFEKTNVEFSDDKRTIFILTKIKDTSFANAKEIMKMAEEGGSFHDSLFAIMKTFANVLNTSVAGWSEAVAAYNEPEDGYGAIFDIYDVCFVFYDSETAQYFFKQAGTDELKVLPEHIFE